jgi:hypothetical protein
VLAAVLPNLCFQLAHQTIQNGIDTHRSSCGATRLLVVLVLLASVRPAGAAEPGGQEDRQARDERRVRREEHL